MKFNLTLTSTRALAAGLLLVVCASAAGCGRGGGAAGKGDAAAAPGPAAARFTSGEGKFTVAAPAGFDAFTEKTEKTPTPLGEGESHYFTSRGARGLSMVEYHLLPAAVFEKNDARAGLEGMRDQFLSKVSGVAEAQEPTDFRGHPALDVRGFNPLPDNKGFGYFRLKYVAAPPRVYRVGYISVEKADLDSAEVNAYFDSFQITN